MKVLNLRCTHGHAFEGWFASEDEFRDQLTRELVECPLCADRAITRLPSAPRLNVARRRDAADEAPPAADAHTAAQAQWLRAMRRMIDKTEDVGERFPEEARRIHYGEARERGIRGQASREEADALRDEGIEVQALPVPTALLKGPAQ